METQLLVKILRVSLITLVLLVLMTLSSKATTYYAVLSYYWENPIWSLTPNGSPSLPWPVAGDTAVINSGITVTENGTDACACLKLGNNNSSSAGTLVFGTSNAALIVYGTVTIGNSSPGVIDMTSGGTLTCQGFAYSAGTLTPGSGTVVLNGSFNMIPPGAPGMSTFNNLIISGTTYLENNPTTINGDLTIIVNETLNVTSSTLNLKGDFNCAGTFNPGGSTVYFNGSEAQSIAGGSPITFYQVTIANTGSASNNTVTLNEPNVFNECKYDFTINSGCFVINSNNELLVDSTLTNNAGTSGLVINDGGSLIYQHGTPAGTVKRSLYIIPGMLGNTTDHFLSSPVTSTTFGNVFSPYNDGYNIWGLRYYEPSWFNDTTAGWVSEYYYDSFVPGAGYSMAFADTLGPWKTATFSGTFNPDGVTQTVTNTPHSPNQGWGYLTSGWNLLGNPYTSGISWDYGSGTWHSGVDGSFYIWGGTIQNYYSSNGSTYPLYSTIPAQSGFFVHRTSTGSAAITIPWAARVNGSTELYKEEETVPNTLHLGITRNRFADNTYIQFNPDATADFDTQYDAYKLWGGSAAPQLYSIIPGYVLSINALPSIESNPDVSIGLKVGADTIYTITADGMDSFDPSVPIHLDDLKLGTSIDLRDNPVYSFMAAPGDSANRFRVRFNSAAGISGLKTINIFIYATQDNIVLNNEGNYEGNLLCLQYHGHADGHFADAAGKTIHH